MENKQKVGKAGEDRTCEYLLEKGYKVLYRNYREPWGEIDIIAIAKDKTLVFVEVKAIQESGNAAKAGFMPEDNLTKAKLGKLKRTCAMFAAKHPELIDERRGWRIDLLALTMAGESGLVPAIINHYEGI